MPVFDPVVLFFLLGIAGTLSRSGLRVPQEFYHLLNIYLLLSIGIKGGLELYHAGLGSLFRPAVMTLFSGIAITLLAFLLLKALFRFDRDNSLAIATHYGSVSAVTFAVVCTALKDSGMAYEPYMTVLLVMLEIPAILVLITLYNLGHQQKQRSIGLLLREIFLGKSMLLLLGGLFIGSYIGFTGNNQLNFFFLDLFKGFLALFMLEMGVIAAERIQEVRKVGTNLVIFGIGMPILSAILGCLAAWLGGLSVGGAAVLATMAASASYIAAPAAVRMIIPHANPGYYLTAALGVTFPFNILFGIGIYRQMALWLYHWLGHTL